MMYFVCLLESATNRAPLANRTQRKGPTKNRKSLKSIRNFEEPAPVFHHRSIPDAQPLTACAFLV